MKVLFLRRGAQTASHFRGNARYVQNVPRSASTSEEVLKKNYATTKNKGNMFIAEAAQRIISCDRSRSTHLNIEGIKNGDPFEAAKFVNRNFDYVVFSVANIIRPSLVHEHAAAFVESLELPFAVLAAGMQSPMQNGLSDLPTSTAKMLATFDRKARLFGVRGEETATWLHRAGLTNCVVTGCPSNFLYPENFLMAADTEVGLDGYFATSGYVATKPDRTKLLYDVFKDHRVDYFFQEDFFHDKKGFPLPDGVYNDATGECDAQYFSNRVSEIQGGQEPPFRRYWYFQSTEAWRSRLASYDAFIGDRYHGAVAALQTGVPSVVFHRDIRVREMCNWVGIPNISLGEADGMNAGDIVRTTLNADKRIEFKERYSKAYLHFIDALEAAGLEHNLKQDTISRLRQA